MTSLRRRGGSGDGGGGGSGGGGGRPSSCCGAVWWGAFGGGQQRQRESLTPQQLNEWWTSRVGGGDSSGSHSAAVQFGVPGGGLMHLQRRPHETLTPQQLREWYVQRGASPSSTRCPYVIRTGDRAGQTCGTVGHTQSCCFSCLCDTWRAEFDDAAELPRWLDLARQRVDIFALDYDAILTAMYALSASAEGDCSRCVPPDPGVAAAALGATASGTPPSTAPAKALHSFTLDSGASRCFISDSTTLTPLPAPVPVRLADPSGGPVVARSSTVLPLPLPFKTTTPGGQRVSICMCTRTGRHLATFTHRPGSSVYTLATKPPHVAVSAQVSTSAQVAASCSCRLLSHQTLRWHHRLGHPSLPRLRGMHSRLLVSGLPRSLPPLPPSPAPPCLPSVEGRQRAAPHSSSFPPTSAPLQTLHMDVWGPARVSGESRERYFLLVVDDYTRYTTVFPLRSKGEVSAILIPWIRIVCLQLRERFGQDLPVLRLHSDRGGEFSSDLLRDFFRGEGITQSFTLPDSPQQNGIAERRIGLVMEVARTSMIHAAAPHFLWPFAVRYAAHQLNLWPRVSLPETSPTLRWTGKVGDASVFRVWGSRAFVRDTSADKLSARAIPCVFLGFVPDAPGWQFYHPTSRRVLPSQDVTFDESVPFYRLFPYRSAPSPPLPLFLAPGPPPVDPLPPQGPAPSGVSQVDPLPGTAPVQVAVVSGAAPGATSGGTASGGAEPGGAGSEGAGSGGAEREGVEPGGAESEGAEPRGAASSGGPACASPRLSSQQLSEWLVQRAHRRSGAPGAGEPGDTGVGGAAVTIGAGDPTEPGAAGARGARAGVAGVRGPSAGGAGAAGAGAVDPGAGGAGGTVRPRPYFVPLLQQVLGVPFSTGLTPPFLCPPLDQSQPPLQPASPLPVPSPYTEQSGGLTERREPVSRPVLPVRTARRAPRSRPPPVPGTHTMALRPSSIPLRVPLLAPPESSLPEVRDPESDRARAASPSVACLLATAVTSPSFESAAASALVAEQLDLATACRLDYASALVTESVPAIPPSVGGIRRTAPDARDIPTPRSYAEAITGPYSSQWQAVMDAEMASWKSTGTNVDEVPPRGVNVVDGMWIFRVKRPPGSPPPFKARYVARGFSQRHGVDYFQTFSPTLKMTTLWVLLHVAAQRDYELHSLDFSTTFLQGSLHEEMWLRRPPGFTGSFPAGTQWSLRRPVYSLRQAPREWHDTPRTTLAALGFVPSIADPSLFLRTDTSLPPFYVLVHSLSAPPSDDSVEPSGPYPELVGCLMYLMTCTRPDLAYPLSLLARYVAPSRHRKGYTFSLGSGSDSWRFTRSSSILSSSCEAEIYARAMAPKKLRWLIYFLTDLGEQPRSPPLLYVDNKAIIALCQEHRLEHRSKHIALRYFLAQELQQRGQLHLAYVATWANTADVFTKALPPDKFPFKEKPTQQLTFILLAQEEDEESEVPPQVEKEAENGGGENEESDDEVMEVPLTAVATSSTSSSPPLALTRERHVPRPHPKYDDYATAAVGELDKEGTPSGLGARESVGESSVVGRLYAPNPPRALRRGEGILQSFTLPDSPQQNGIAERRIGLVVELARTSMIHAAAPHFLWPFVVQYVAHQLNLWPRVSFPETSPTLSWTEKVGDASVFRVWGSRAFVCDTSADKLSARAILCVFLGFSPDALGWQFYHPTSRRVFPSLDVTFDESVPFNRSSSLKCVSCRPSPLYCAC
ncbi:unnamed protein product [Closterium sp. NIES-54]